MKKIIQIVCGCLIWIVLILAGLIWLGSCEHNKSKAKEETQAESSSVESSSEQSSGPVKGLIESSSKQKTESSSEPATEQDSATASEPSTVSYLDADSKETNTLTEEQKYIITQFRIQLRQQLDKMMKFKNTDEFAFYLWGRGGRFHVWLDDTSRIRNNMQKYNFIPTDLQCVPGDMINLATEYGEHHGAETAVTKILMKDIKRSLTYEKRMITIADCNHIRQGISNEYLQEILQPIQNVKKILSNDGIIYQIKGDDILVSISVQNDAVNHIKITQTQK